jgi:hypothetical protein
MLFSVSVSKDFSGFDFEGFFRFFGMIIRKEIGALEKEKDGSEEFIIVKLWLV